MVLFAAITMIVWAAVAGIWWARSAGRGAGGLDRIRARLSATAEVRGTANESPALIRKEDLATGKFVLKLLERLRLNERLRLLFEQAGLKWNVARTVHVSLGLFLVAFTACWYLAPLYRAAAPPAGLAAGALPAFYVARKRGARMARFEEQFPEALEFLSRAMRAGHAFSVSLEMIHMEFREPVSGEFKRAFDEQNLGMPIEAALLKMGSRVPSMDVQFFVSAVLLQKRTGGNLAELLDKLAQIIRERFKLRARIRAISAHGRMTGTVLSIIPIVVGGMMCWVNPGYAKFFAEDDTGKAMIAAGVAFQLIGYGVIRKIVSIEV
jgi:tight adherence protein B